MSIYYGCVLTLICTLLMLSPIFGDEKPDPQVQAVVDYFAKEGIKLEKAKEGGWNVLDPKPKGYYVVVYFKTFPAQATEKEMQNTLNATNLAFMLNAQAKLAMSYPGLRADAPGVPKYKAPDLEKLPIKAKLEKLFMQYRLEKEKK